MAWTNLKITVAIGVCAVTAVTTLVVESKKASDLRAQNEILVAEAQQNQRLRDDEMARLRSANEELKRLQRETVEVHKLRGEAAQLRSEKLDAAALRAENTRLRNRLSQISPASEPDPAASEEKEAEKKLFIGKMTGLKQMMFGFVLHAEKNNGEFPADFNRVFSLNHPSIPQDLQSALDWNAYEIVYTGRLDTLKSPTMTIVIREKEPVQTRDGKWTRAYGFGDGHAEIHAAPEGQFDAWEKARMATNIGRE